MGGMGGIGGTESLSSFVVCNPSNPRGCQRTVHEVNIDRAQNNPYRQSSVEQVNQLLEEDLA
jgi:hypothetical protein